MSFNNNLLMLVLTLTLSSSSNLYATDTTSNISRVNILDENGEIVILDEDDTTTIDIEGFR